MGFYIYIFFYIIILENIKIFVIQIQQFVLIINFLHYYQNQK